MPRIELACPSAPRASVIIPAAGDLDLLVACLGSLARHGPRDVPFETIVVLNAPPQGTAERLAEAVSGARIEASPVNLGLAGAGNRGRALARGEHLVLLHDDAEIEPGWLEALVAAAAARPEAGAIGSRVLHPDGRLQNAGMILWRDGTTSDAWVGPAPPADTFAERRAVDYCGTSSLLVRARSWDEVGGLDEQNFPGYYVDVDLALALRARGQVVLYEPGSVIRHRRGASFSAGFRHFVSDRNRDRLRAKWGAALQAHEPPVPASAEAVARAVARAEDEAARLRRAFVPRDAGPRPPATLDRALQERRCLELDLAVHRAYARELEARLAAQTAVGAALRSELEAGRARAAHERAAIESALPELRARAAVLEQIESGRFWRLYQRLLPVLRRLRRRRG